jgi:NAD/NADP transhydrogenase beta subunit
MTPFPGTDTIIELTYLIATALFVMSLKWMSSPTTARHGVWAGEAGMLLAIIGTLLNRSIVDYKWVAIALVLGTIIGVPLGKVHMTAVPQRTALSHAFGACCVTLVGTAEFYLRAPAVPKFMMSVLSMEVILGSLTFTGSLMAAGKLQEILPQRPIIFKGQNYVNLDASCRHWPGRFSSASSGSHVPLSFDPRDPAAVRRDDDHPDRRRGYAYCNFAAERLRRAFRVREGIRAR